MQARRPLRVGGLGFGCPRVDRVVQRRRETEQHEQLAPHTRQLERDNHELHGHERRREHKHRERSVEPQHKHLASVLRIGETRRMTDQQAPFNPHEVEQHVRLTGSPGVRARQTSASGQTQHTRASGVPHVGEVRSVPIATLTKVRALLTLEDVVRPAADVLRELHELLEPWF
jgi:hypothetical protein